MLLVGKNRFFLDKEVLECYDMPTFLKGALRYEPVLFLRVVALLLLFVCYQIASA